MTEFLITDNDVVWREDGSGFDILNPPTMQNGDSLTFQVTAPVWRKVLDQRGGGFSMSCSYDPSLKEKK